MKKIIIFFLIIFLIANVSNSQTGWYWQNPFPQGNNLKSVFFVNQYTGWSAGEKGTIIKTTNGGENWMSRNIPYWLLDSTVYSISFVDTLNGFACCGNVIKTTNGGNNWNIVNVNDNYVFNKIYFINNSTGLLVGYNNNYGSGNVVLRTTNSGSNWSQVFSYYGDSYYGSVIKFLNTNTGWWYNSWYCFKTINYGLNWNQIPFNYSAKDFYFFDTLSGLAVKNISYPSIQNYIGKTTNSGTNFIQLKLFSDTSLYSISFFNSNTGFIASGRGIILRSTDKGNNWNSIQTQGKKEFISSYVIDSNKGITVGNSGLIAKSSDMGISWQMKSSVWGTDLYNLFFVNQNTGFAAGDSILLKTTNSGVNWFSLMDSNFIFSKIFFINENTGWLLTDGFNSLVPKKIFKTTNNGLNWVFISSIRENMLNGLQYFINDIYFLNGNTGWLTGTRWEQHPPYASWFSGCYFKTTNGGLNWSETYTSSCKGLGRIFFTDMNNGWIISNTFDLNENPRLLKTNDGGNSWSNLQIDLNFVTTANQIFFVNQNTGWYIGNSPYYGVVIYKSINGGNNWFNIGTIQNFFMSSYFWIYSHSLYFSDLNNGWICGKEGKLYATSNGGINWIKQMTPTNSNLTTVVFINNNIGWITGGGGCIIKTTSGISSKISDKSVGFSSTFSLSQNYPNPFNPTTNIKFNVESYKVIKLIVYDILGKEVSTLVNEKLKPGEYEVSFDGNSLSSGIYFYSMYVDGNLIDTKKMVFLK